MSCDPRTVSNCVSEDPAAGLALVRNPVTLTGLVIILFLSMQGNLRITNRDSIESWFKNSLLPGFKQLVQPTRTFEKDVTGALVSVHKTAVVRSGEQRTMLLVFYMTLLLSGFGFYQLWDTEWYVSALTASLIVFAAYLGVRRGVIFKSIAAGLGLSAFVAGIAYVAYGFRIREGNEEGSIAMNILTAYIVLSLVAWFGSS